MYLIQSRLRKMPYKAIAAHLHKTDLACRLHYHQLGTPNNRHERTPSISSSSVTSQCSASTPLRSTSAMRRDTSPASAMENPRRVGSASIELISLVASPPVSHGIILPNPVSSPNHRLKPLRLDTTNLSDYHPRATSKIDEARLHRIYHSRQQHFWALVAADYGSNIAPATLEKAWYHMMSAARSTDPLPTPCVSPQSPTAAPLVLAHACSVPKTGDCPSQFHAVNQVPTALPVAMAVEKSNLAISSLLTEEKEVRHSKRGGS